MSAKALSAGGAELTLQETVVPIDWKRFDRPIEESEHYRPCVEILLNSAHYNVAWMSGVAERIEKEWRTFTTYKQLHNIIRPACAASYAMAVVLKTGVFDEQAVGVSKQEALARTVRLIKAAVIALDGAEWSEKWCAWQSALFAGCVCHAGWMLWHDLDAETREKVAAVAEHEADRFIAPDYRVPYWNSRDGDTKGEENAWDTMTLQVACAMMPEHPHVRQWKDVCSELMLSAYAMEEDVQSEAVVDGRRVKDRICGYNARDDATVVNHNRIHPDYSACICFKLRSYVVQPLAGHPVPEAAAFRAPSVYAAFLTRQWFSPPYEKPGGTIYVPGQAEIYYPQGTDWFAERLAAYYQMDVFAHVLGWDKDLPRPASYWMRLRADKMLKHQLRHPDRRRYAPDEFQTFPGCEQMFFRLLAECFTLQWLDAHGAIREDNWLAEVVIAGDESR